MTKYPVVWFILPTIGVSRPAYNVESKMQQLSSIQRWWTAVLLLVTTTGVHSSYYTRYAEYPEYCSTPDQMAERSIPPLSSSNVQLLHVTAIFRHGARTPWGPNLNCWDDYLSNAETSVWNCNLTADSAPPTPYRARQEGADTNATNDDTIWFEKRYDALTFPQYGVSNYLNGTCQLGQLIDPGYRQEMTNGRFLREAYGGTNDAADVYFRSDDEARTVMSGQLVVRGLLLSNSNTTIPLHTADFDRDIVDPNEKICPRLTELREAHEQSDGYQQFLKQHQALRDFQHDVLKPPRSDIDMHAIDCLMTTMCTDRTVPAAINDYGTNGDTDEWDKLYGAHRFRRLYEYDVQKYTSNLKANDALYAKLAMGPLWYEILQQIRPVLQGHHAPKFHIVSGHDTTVMPLLAALDPALWPDTEWPPYASMMVLELYQNNATNAFLFRIVYNGNILRPTGCSDQQELCDIDVLLNRLEPFAIPNPDCQTTRSTTVPNTTSWTKFSPGLFVFGICLGAILGASATLLIQGRRYDRTATPLPSDDDQDGIMMHGRLNSDDDNSLI